MPSVRPLAALGLSLVLVACRCGGAGEEPPSDPARVKLVQRLGDGRPMVRATAMKELAPAATKFEAFAIARAAKAADETVRIAAAESLGLAPPPEAVDLLSAFLLDPLDTVRAAAVAGLARRPDPKARALVASAYDKGGPRTRAAVADAGPDALARGVALEAEAVAARIDTVLHFDVKTELARASRERRVAGLPQPNAQVRAAALGELARSRGEAAVDEFLAALSSEEPSLVAAGLEALAEVRAVAHAPRIADLLAHPQPAVAEAAARALARLAPGMHVEALMAAIARGDEGLAGAALDALGAAVVEGNASLCKAADKAADLDLAAALMRRGACAHPPEPPAKGPGEARAWAMLRALGLRTPPLIVAARAAVADRDGLVASTAALYLATQGEPADAGLLSTMALAELDLVAGGRVVAQAAEHEAIKSSAAPEAAFLDAIDAYGALAGGKGIKRDTPLTRLIEARRFSREELSFESRPGSSALIAAASAGAARLGGDVTAVVEALLASGQSRLRRLAAEAADLATGAAAEAVRERVRAAPDAEVRLIMAMRDAAAGRPEAVARLVALAASIPDHLELEVAGTLASVGEPARAPLLRLVEEGGAAAVPALEGLSRLSGDDVDALVAREASSTTPPIARAAVRALAERPGDWGAALGRAATHPEPSVRAAALDALAQRRACALAPRLAPLANDVSRGVRLAAGRFVGACPPGP